MSSSNCKDKWNTVWKDIANGGAMRWRYNEGKHELKTYERLCQSIKMIEKVNEILVPLCGDSLFGVVSAQHGHHVNCIDISPIALQHERKRFEEENLLDKVNLIEDNIFVVNDQLRNKIDLIYDKDAFGAINIDERDKYINVMKQYLNGKHAHIYMEVKDMSHIPNYDLNKGPPFFITRNILQQYFNIIEDYGILYEYESNKWSQHAYLLKIKDE